jgi:hypothetical protein
MLASFEPMPPQADAVHLVTFAVPGSSGYPMEVKVAHSGLRMVLVNRESIGFLNGTWKVLGIYFLLRSGFRSRPCGSVLMSYRAALLLGST